MRRIKEKLLRGRRQHNMWIPHIDRDITMFRRLFAQCGDQLRRIFESLGKQEAAPAAIDLSGFLGVSPVVTPVMAMA